MTDLLLSSDVVIVGGGLGGTAAALTAADLGLHVTLTCADEWLGGQLTSQGVPPDEYRWIEEIQPTRSYAMLRTRLRDRYRWDYPLTGAAQHDPALNPGRGRVSRLCVEPRVAAMAMEEILSAHIAAGRVRVLRGVVPTAVDRSGDEIRAVTVHSAHDDARWELRGSLFVDATELGDLLPLAAADYVIGAESAGETGELHAPTVANPADQQAITWCAALEFAPGCENVIDRPASYGHWAQHVPSFWPGPQLSWTALNVRTLQTLEMPLFPGDAADESDLWRYRRVLGADNFDATWGGHEVSIMNWPHNDYWEAPLLGDGADAETAGRAARELTLSMIHWMQTAAPRHDGGTGYPELRLRGDVMGTGDGLAREPYIRESRRARTIFTVTEEHIGTDMRGPGVGAAQFADSVGIGCYRIDLHPSTAARSFVDIGSFPFQIPLGALLPRDVSNLLPANKNIGTTHITNGAYRLHPVEWSIGVAVGALAALTIAERAAPRDLLARPALLETLQQQLLADRLGVRLSWPDEYRTRDGI